MALIKCKECGKEISSQAEKCPNCGNIMKGKTKNKKVGVIVVLIASSISVILSILLKIASLVPTKISEKEPIITIGIEPNATIFNGVLQPIINTIYWGFPLLLILLSVLRLTKNVPSKKICGITSLIVSIIWSFILVIYISNGSCCDVVFLVNSITALIGSIITLLELLRERKNEIKENNK